LLNKEVKNKVSKQLRRIPSFAVALPKGAGGGSEDDDPLDAFMVGNARTLTQEEIDDREERLAQQGV
jgi:hypothetical protein